MEGIGITGQKADAHIVHFLIAQLLPIDGGEVFHVQAEQIEVFQHFRTSLRAPLQIDHVNMGEGQFVSSEKHEKKRNQ